MKRALRWLLDLDRSYFLAFSALVAALVASIYFAVVPTYVSASSGGDETSRTLIEVNGAWVIVLLIIPVLITVGPLLVLPRQTSPIRRNHKVNSVVTTLVLLVFIGLGAWSIGLLYVPTLILSSASSASLFFGRDRKPRAAETKRDRRREERARRDPRQVADQDNQPRMSGKRARRRRAKR